MYKSLEKISYLIDEKLKSGSNVDVVIAKFLIKCIKNGGKLPGIQVLAKNLNVSTSSLSRFIKNLELDNYAVLKYLINNNQTQINNLPKNPNITKFANMIDNADKVYFWGSQDSGIICKDFHTKLLRLGINSLYISDPFTQIGISRNSSKSDLLIIISISAKHNFFIEEIEKVKAKKLLITATRDSKNLLLQKSDSVIHIPVKSIFPRHRLVSFAERINAYYIIDSIIDELLKKPEYFANNKNAL